VLEIQLPAIFRARSTAPNGEHDPRGEDGSGLPENHVLGPSVRRLRTMPAVPPTDGDAPRPGADVVPIEEEDVPIGELLHWERADEQRPIDARIGRLASLLGIAAVVIVVLVLVFAAGTDVASVFRSLPGS
jgi:hypothetical protein